MPSSAPPSPADKGVTLPPARADPAPLLVRDDTPNLVDLQVSISGGRAEVRGQTLFWWYDVPAEGRSCARVRA